jgi:hypothetical protein
MSKIQERIEELMIVKEIHENCFSQYLSKEETTRKLYYYKPEMVSLGNLFFTLTQNSLE